MDYLKNRTLTMVINPDDLVLSTVPLAEPVTLAEAKAHLRVDFDDDDALINLQIQAARGWIEQELNISMVQRTYVAAVPYFAECFELPRTPLASVTSIRYWTNTSPQEQLTLAANVYEVDTRRNRICRGYGYNWPLHAWRQDAVEITFVAGQAPSDTSPIDHAANVPATLKSALLLLLGDLYENRESNSPLRMHELPAAQRLMQLYRRYQ